MAGVLTRWFRPKHIPVTERVAIVQLSTVTGTPLRWWKGYDSRSWTRYRDRATVFTSTQNAEQAIQEYCLHDAGGTVHIVVL